MAPGRLVSDLLIVELTRQRKALFAVLGVGALALIADRMISTPATVEAGGRMYAPVALPPGPGVKQASPGESSRIDPPLLHRMRELPEATQYDSVAKLDAFKPPASWVPEAPVVEVAAPVVESAADIFQRSHRLTAVLSGPAGEFAVIGGRTLAIGQDLDGFILVAVGTRSAVFRWEDAEVTLTLREPGSRPGGR
jgi:hypothetical protein